MLLLVCLGLYQIGSKIATGVLQGRFPEVAGYFVRRSDSASGVSDPVPEGAPGVWKRTNSGLAVFDVCNSTWETPLPSTPYFNRFLRLRDPRDLSKGFRSQLDVNASHFGYTIAPHDQPCETVYPE